MDWGPYLKVLLPIWPPRPKIDNGLVIAILEDVMLEGNRPGGSKTRHKSQLKVEIVGVPR